jgi:hypothetical protein
MQALLQRNPAKYYEYRESCVAHGLLAPKAEKLVTPERQTVSQRELELRQKYTYQGLKEKFTTVKTRKEDTLAYIEQNQPELYAEILEAGVLFGLIPAERLRSITPKPPKPEQETLMRLSDELADAANLPRGKEMSDDEINSVILFVAEKKQAARDAQAAKDAEAQQF